MSAPGATLPAVGEAAALIAQVPMLAAVPGPAHLHRRRLRLPAIAFHGAGSVPSAALLVRLHERAMLVADAPAARAMERAGTLADVALADSTRGVPAALAVAGGPETIPEPGASPHPLLLLPYESAWLARALGHGACSLPGAGDDLLTLAACLGPGPLLWSGAAPASWAALCGGLGLGEPQREVLCDRRFEAWYPEQGRAELDAVSVAWQPLDRAAAEDSLRSAVSLPPEVNADLLPGLVARSALARARQGGGWVDGDHDAWLELGATLFEAVAGDTRGVSDADEHDKYRAFWASGHHGGHTSPGERVYPVVRDYVRGLGCRTFLDLGCGAGEVLEAAAADGLEPLGVDLVDGLCGASRERFRSRLLLGSAWDLPLRDGCVDFAFSSDVFEHLPPSRLEAAFDELRRVCTRGAALAISARADITGLKWGALLHLSVFPLSFWRERLERRFHVRYAVEAGRGLNPHYILLLQSR